ncbi:unnamed protein product [Caenorhabditis brenneri]
MNSKPLSYDCLKTVLLHMDAHTRINVSSRIPSIRKAEKSVPLKIKYLCFGFYSIGIDNTEYQVGIFRDYGALKTPNYVEKCNEEGGSYYDIDEDGFEDSSTMEQKILPEDIAIKPLEIKEPLPRNDDTIRQKEAEIIDLKNQISELDTQYKKYLSDHGFETIEELAEQLHSAQERNDEPLYQTLSSAFLEMRFRNAWIMSRLNDIDKIRHYIQCYNDFRNKISPPYRSYIHLTASQTEDLKEGRIGEQIERVEYNKLLPFALRAVSDFIFKGRRHPVYVESIFIEQQNIIRAPCDLKLKIRNVDLFFESPGLASSALKPIIHCSTFPLKELKVRNYLFDPLINSNDFQCELAKNAEKLIIDCSGNNVIWLPILLDLQNKNVEKSDHGFETIEELAEQLQFAQELADENRYKTLYRVFSSTQSTNWRIMRKLEDIDKIRHYIQCCNDFRNKVSPPYKSYIHLTVSQSEDGEEGWVAEHIERMEYNKLLPFALRAVSDFIFKGRRHPVYVELFYIEQQENIIRVPCDLKLKIRNVDLFESPGLAYNSLQSIFHCSSFPLKELKVMSLLDNPIFDSNDFQCELVKDAEKLSILSSGSNAIWLPILLALQNKNVEKMFNWSMEVDDYVALIRAWRHGKSVGTVFTFSSTRTSTGQEVLDRVAEEYQNAVKEDRCVTVPMLNRSSEILVTMWEKDHEIDFLRECFLQLKIVQSRGGPN